MYEKYKEYAYSVLNGEIVAGTYIKQACERYLDFFEKYDFRPDKADKVVNFISKLKHYTGSHNGKPFVLLPYQKWVVYAIFGFYYKGTDRRVTKYVYFEVARKNGKTAFMAAINLYMLIADGESGAECELVANSAKQAKICFTMCSNFLGSIDKKSKYFKRYRDSIKFDTTKSVLQVLSSDAGGNDGYNSYCFLLDECHEQPDSRLWDVMTSSQGMRTNSLAMIATTAGFNMFGFCYTYRNGCLNVLSGLAEDDSQFSAIYTLDDGDDWSDPDNWIKANPSLGVTVRYEYLEEQVKRAKNNTSLEVGTRTKNFNQWVASQDIWITNDLLLKYSQKVDLEFFRDKEVFACCGIDLASVSDLTALAVMVPYGEKFYFKVFYYLPQTALENNSNCELYKEWRRKGFLTITSGNVTDYDYILTDLLKTSQIFSIQKVAYDQYNATQFAIDATNNGMPLEPFSQALWSFNRPVKEFERLVKMGKIIIDNNEITRYCFANVVMKYDHNENCKPTKATAMNKIDGVIAITEALGIYLLTNNYDNSID